MGVRKICHRHRLDQRHRPRHCACASPPAARTSCSTGSAMPARSRRCAPSSPSELRRQRASIAAADMAKTDDIADMIAGAERCIRRRRRAGQQCRHPVRLADRGIPAREMGRDPGDQPVQRLPHHPRCVPGMKKRKLRPHHQHRLGACAGRLAFQVGLCRRQARHRRPHQDGGAGRRRVRRHRQRDLPRLCADAAGRKADPRPGQGARHQRRRLSCRRAARGAADQALRHGRGSGRACRLPGRRPGRLHHRRDHLRSTAAGPRTEPFPKTTGFEFHGDCALIADVLDLAFHAACRAELSEGSVPLRRPRIHGHQLRDRSRHRSARSCRSRWSRSTSRSCTTSSSTCRISPASAATPSPAWSSPACSTARR